ncbi:dolichyl-diphosphooligosaccharide--protein glycosyltransferase subunit 1-like [Watersipora subatra]|uniref:dolichyl-diphosphooligosaccharide--protein glycosyltransferase subunit 1-like n=1 Tax=Watersipora subatra TaxID=2589382 RepID=UPI00355C23F0
MRSVIVFLSVFVLAHCKVNSESFSAVVNKDVQRQLDLSSAVVKITNEITMENTGKGAVKSYIFAIEDEFHGALASISASTKSGDDGTQLATKSVSVEGTVGHFYEISLPKPVASGKTAEITVTAYFSHVLVPFPAEVKQAEKQLVKYSGNLYFYSPYATSSQTSVVSLSSATVESYTKTKPSTKSDSTITYGPFETVKDAFEYADLTIHYENNTPFLAVTSMVRVIEVSHWGNIAVEETYNIRHTGAKLKGSFSRYDYQRQQSTFGSVKSFKTVLPASAADVYYRDEIGNISTSNMKEMDDAVELELRPRFPLFGGWKTHYVIGYNVPSYQYLWTDGGNDFSLKMPFVDHIFDNQVVDDMTVKIILPEGSDVKDIKVPFEFQRDTDEAQYTYLDTIGRPVIVLSKKNLVDHHIQDFALRYSFNKLTLLREPLMVVGFFYLIFLFVIIYVRLDFSISRDEAAESKLKVASYIESVQSVLDRRSALYQAYDDAVNKYKASKDLSAYQAQRKKVDADHTELTAQLSSFQSQLKSEGADAAVEKLVEIQAMDGVYKDSVRASFTLAEKLLAGKMTKDAYVSQEELAATKRADLLNKMENYASQL